MNQKIVLYCYQLCKKYKALRAFFLIVGQIGPIAIGVVYFLILRQRFIVENNMNILLFLLPFSTFVIVTVLRMEINAKRPFEVLAIVPLIDHKPGQSFPSRHTASAFILSFMAYYVNPFIGAILFCFSGLIGISRIFLGVHYPRDILAGAMLGVIIGIIIYI